MSTTEMGLCISCMAPMAEDGLCPHCGYDNGLPNASGSLQPGTILGGRYAVGAMRSRNSEGAVYAGYDGEKDHRVWIVEYAPASISERDETGAIVPKPGSGAQYKALMSDYVDICNAVRRLSVSDSVIPIENVVSGNNTIYAVYSRLDAVTLEEYLERNGSIPLKQAIRMFGPLCEAVTNMHARGDIHRGISPKNVYIDEKGRLYLWGFALGATRTGGSELEAELFNGYSAPEQYASNGWQGPWTDVYAMAALFYRVVSGVTPPKSTLIGSQRMVAPLTDLVDDMPKNIASAVADAMGIAAGDRTQTMMTFSSRLILLDGLSSTAATAVYDLGKVEGARIPDTPEGRAGTSRTNRQKKDSESGVSVKYVLLALFCTVLILGGFIWFLTTTYFSDLVPDSSGVGNDRESSSLSSGQQSESESESESVSASQPESSREEDKSVPDFIGRERDSVVSDEAYKSRFTFDVREEFNDDYPEGQVFDQAPVSGVIMANKGTVILYVSKGKLSVVMPDLSDATPEEAEEAFAELAEEYNSPFMISYIDRYAVTTEPGLVIGTLPAAGEEFDPRTTNIIVYVSLVPDIGETTESESSSSKLPPLPKKDPENPERDM